MIWIMMEIFIFPVKKRQILMALIMHIISRLLRFHIMLGLKKAKTNGEL